MALIYDLFVGVIIGTVILVIIYKVRNRDLAEPFNLLSALFESYLSGMTIYIGFASVYYSLFNSLPFELSTLANENIILFFGGLSIISITFITLFKKEILSNGKLIFFKDDETNLPEISVDRINYCHSYLGYKNNTNDAELNVISFFKDGTLQVDTRNLQTEISKKILFDLMVRTQEYVNGVKEEIPSQSIAVCKIISFSDISCFKIIKWCGKKEYKTIINDLKDNKKIKSLKPVIKLKHDYLAEKYALTDIEAVKNGIDNLIKSQSGE
jgi:hypothetical protein